MWTYIKTLFKRDPNLISFRLTAKMCRGLNYCQPNNCPIAKTMQKRGFPNARVDPMGVYLSDESKTYHYKFVDSIQGQIINLIQGKRTKSILVKLRKV